MKRIVRNDGIYVTHIKIHNQYPNNYIFNGIFFVEQYMCFEWEPVEDPIIVNSAFLKHLTSWRDEIFEAIKSGEILKDEAKSKFAIFNEKANKVVEARFIEPDQSYKDIVLIPQLFGGVSLIVDTHVFEYDFEDINKSGFKDKRMVNNESLKFHSY